MADGQDLRNSALEAYWMPFTANKAFKAQPRLLAAAKDMHYFTPDGRAGTAHPGQQLDPSAAQGPAALDSPGGSRKT